MDSHYLGRNCNVYQLLFVFYRTLNIQIIIVWISGLTFKSIVNCNSDCACKWA